MRPAHQAVRQAAIELGLAESALQHPSELGLRHTFTALAMGKISTVRSGSARAKAQSAYAQTLTNHDMPEPQILTLLTGVLAMSLAELHAGTLYATVPRLCLIQISLCLHNVSSTTISVRRLAMQSCPWHMALSDTSLLPRPHPVPGLCVQVGGAAHTSNGLPWGCSAQGLQLQM